MHLGLACDLCILFFSLCSLVSHKECCTLSGGQFIKSGLDELEKWCGEATEEVNS